ncbi:hypothetical protein Rsub_02698 [Raphidocelis subcapitata]|uniref:Uncharacterized protein n=1 Tax=Raphidocelis subcapitata TaxID=307507 RepID=A0A2V0NTJ4_9CHLO|nr:hypothetical protein Rsub_02698 [Raphidocelis subcapitata]|eukprot:GBF89992.1 hypothetical protein Rsub_02698 [Raphidocelis subcapitata]
MRDHSPRPRPAAPPPPRAASSGGAAAGAAAAPAPARQPDRAAAAALMARVGRPEGSFPPDFAAAIAGGRVGPELLQRYLDLEGQLVVGWLMRFPGFRERLLADPSFLVKLAIEVGIGICTKCTAELTKRGPAFGSELDFVAANVLMALIADFMLVWLPAPTFALGDGRASRFDPLGRAFAGCPDNAFQLVQPGMAPFTPLQRLGAPVRNGTKLFAVGCGASFVGVAVTNGLIALRGVLDPGFAPLNQPQNVLATSLAYGVYMATSSNIRYQIVAGVIEERGIERLFAGNYRLCAALSLLVRTGNTFLGSLLWVDFVRLLGMQRAH